MQLTYDVEVGDAIEQKELPFVVGVVGDFAGESLQPQAKVRDRKFVGLDLDNFDDVMAGVAPRAAFSGRIASPRPMASLRVDLTFEAFEDFRPEAVVSKVEPLRKLMEARSRFADLRNKLAGNERPRICSARCCITPISSSRWGRRRSTEARRTSNERSTPLQEETQAVLEGGSLLDRIIDESRIARSSAEHERARDLIGELVEQVLEGELVPSENLSASLDARVAELDALISAQLSEILHAPEFQRLESA